MMQTIISILLLTLIASESFSQKKDILYLWPGKVPGELIRIIRRNAAKWSIDPEKVGIIGFSAGGSLSARTSTKTVPS